MEFTEICYEELPGFPGLRTFRCEPLQACLSPESCARNVRCHQYIQCSRCPVGAVHAATCAPQPDEKLSWKGIPYRGVAPAERCVRCGTASLRLIRRRTICASCYNREREVRIGANAKGTRPKLAAKVLHHATCQVDGAEAPKVVELDFCSGRREAELVIGRWWPGAVLMAYEARSANF